MKSWIILISLFCPLICFSQKIISGPIVGGVTTNQARVYVQTLVPSTIEIEIGSDTTFQTITNFRQATDENFGNSTIISLTGLEASTTYYYRIRVNDSLQAGVYSFQTFPKADRNGNFMFTVGACQMRGKNPISEPIFQIICQHKPQLFLEVGDWGYPDTTDNIPKNNSFFPA
ncbi:MAG: hypothetical protein NZ108_02890, partial [Bacteroidia bacterium]|nr:hypothetical protein [Bacteroidia bacterium]